MTSGYPEDRSDYTADTSGSDSPWSADFGAPAAESPASDLSSESPSEAVAAERAEDLPADLDSYLYGDQQATAASDGARYSTPPHGAPQYGAEQYVVRQYGTPPYDAAPTGPGAGQYGPDQYAQPYGSPTYAQDPRAQDPHAQDLYGQGLYGPDPYGPDPYGRGPYGRSAYGQDPYGYAAYGDPGAHGPAGYGQPLPYAPLPPMYGYYGQLPQHPEAGLVLGLGIVSLMIPFVCFFAWHFGARAMDQIRMGAPYDPQGPLTVGFWIGKIVSLLTLIPLLLVVPALLLATL